MEDLSGQRFDSLYVKEFDAEASKKYKQSFWKCTCDCGREISVSAYRLINKIKRNCGHCNDPKPGDVFGFYTVIGKNESESKRRNHSCYNVICVCGNKRIVDKGDLIRGKSTNCGCIASLNKRDTEDITNQKFGHWTALNYNEEESKKTTCTMWDCRCDCGTIKPVSIHALKNGKSTSCGCHAYDNRKKLAIKREKERPNWRRLKKLYYAMVDRCTNPNNPEADNYYFRGIRVCSRWTDPNRGFDNFYEDMHPSYVPGLTLDRINVNGPYEPDNCRWITLREQGFNKTNTRYVEYYGMKISLAEIAYKFYNPANVSTSKLYNRIMFGFSIDEALQVPKGIRSREVFYKENPNFKVIHKAFMFTHELDAMNLLAESINYDEYRMNPIQINQFIYSRPIAEYYLQGYHNITFDKEKDVKAPFTFINKE